MNAYESTAIVVAERYVGDIPLSDKAAKLGEEITELAMAFGAKDTDNIREEIGDVGFLLLHIAYKMNPQKSLQTYIDETMAKMVIHYTSSQDLMKEYVPYLGAYAMRLSAALALSKKDVIAELIGSCAYLLYRINDAYNDVYVHKIEHKNSIFWRIEDASEKMKRRALNKTNDQ